MAKVAVAAVAAVAAVVVGRESSAKSERGAVSELRRTWATDSSLLTPPPLRCTRCRCPGSPRGTRCSLGLSRDSYRRAAK